jgi:thioester reductase-like protein
LFTYGVDSVASIQIRHAVSQLLSRETEGLPISVVEDCGNTAKLADLVRRRRHGLSPEVDEDHHRVMQEMVRKYSVFESPISPSLLQSTQKQNGIKPQTILLTGPTGSLGAHILHQLLHSPSSPRIYLLVRGATPHAARERVFKALSSRQLPVPPDFDERVTIFPCKLSDVTLGLSDEEYALLANGVDVIVHLAWFVNFLLPLNSFVPHLAGLRNLLSLAFARRRLRSGSESESESERPNNEGAPMKFIFCSSVASISNYASLFTSKNDLKIASSANIPEQVASNPECTGPTGYSRSKWVAEQICAAAWTKTQAQTHSQSQSQSASSFTHPANGNTINISAIRVGQLSGATDTGVWSKTEAYPLLLSSAKETGVLPDLGAEETLSWLPVDIAAAAFVDVIHGRQNDDQKQNGGIVSVDNVAELGAKQASQVNGTDGGATHGSARGKEMPIYHLLNPDERTTWHDLLRWIQNQDRDRDQGQVDHQPPPTPPPTPPPPKTVPVKQWLDTLSRLQAPQGHPTQPASKTSSSSNANAHSST